jgi:hypothetical protein
MTPSSLPTAATEKLQELQLARDSAQDGMRGAQARANNLPGSAGKLHERLIAEREKFAERHRVLALLINRLNQGIVELRLPLGTVLESASPVDIKLKANESLAEAVGNVRREIVRIKMEIAGTRAAPIKVGNRREAVTRHLAQLALAARPRLAFDQQHGNPKFHWTEELITSKNDLVGLLMYFFGHEPILAAFDLDKPDAPDALSLQERDERIATLTNSLLLLERREEAMIEKAESDGVEILRRADASPLAVLSIAIVAQQAQAVA